VLRRACLLILIVLAPLASAADLREGSSSPAQTIASCQGKMVKIYGAGGVRGLEPYQSGFLISDRGHILTVWSYVLDTDYITVTLNDGQKFEAKLLGADPRLELAVLKIEATDLAHFTLSESTAADSGTRVLALSNLFGVASGDEPASVQHGIIAVKTTLDARQGVYATPYHGPIYVLDAMTNNPGAAGGALTNLSGQLLGMLGKELRSSLNNTWLNYSVPIDRLATSVDEILAGKSRPRGEEPKTRRRGGLDAEQIGIVLVPDVLERTPPYIDAVRARSPAAQAGLRPDDLVLFVGDHLVQSCKALADELSQFEPDAEVELVVMRGQQLIDAVLKIVAQEKSEQK
jgi:serine protease Do